MQSVKPYMSFEASAPAASVAQNRERPHAVVIGSGFGGLAAAVRMGARGWRVTVLEKLDAPGGRAYVHRRDGFTFDAGPTIITAPYLFDELWALCGRRREDDVELRAMDPFYRIRFDDGTHFDYCGDPVRMRAEVARFCPADVAGYDRFMGVWSRLVGQDFLDWIAPKHSQRWLDVGCGNGAFTQLIAEQCEPLTLVGIDPSEAQLAYARQQPLLQSVEFVNADAMALPFPDDAFDLAVMPLVIFFVPEPAQGVAEMARVVAPGGTVAAYAWDMEGGGFPYQRVNETLGAVGRAVPMPPSVSSSRLDTLSDLWVAAGLRDIHTRVITVERTYTDFDNLWNTVIGGPSAGQALAAMSEEERTRFRELLQARLQPSGSGSISLTGRAHAIRGTVPSL